MQRWMLRWLFLMVCAVLSVSVLAQGENKDGFPTPELVVIPGTIQSKLGCDGDWKPDCENTALTYDVDGDIWTGTFALPAGSYEYKVALDGAWDRNYGANGEASGANIKLVLETDTEVTFTYDHKTGLVTDSVNGGGSVGSAPEAPAKVIPTMVNTPGTIQPVLGCPGEWQPECETTALEYNEAWDVWTRTWETLPAGNYEYKVAINGSWTENYGGSADKDGPNIVLAVAEDSPITFFYDHKTHWIADTIRNTIVTAPGDYQTFLGCETNNDPACMATWLQDPDGDGIFTFTTNAIPAGDYTAQFALGQVLEGAGEPVTFSVAEDGTNVSFTYDSELNLMVVSAGGAAISSANLRDLTAHWVTANTLLWDVEVSDGATYKLLYSADGTMSISLFGLEGAYESLDLSVADGDVPADVLAKFPHLEGMQAFTIAEGDVPMVGDILRGQVAIATYNGDALVDIAGIQIPGVLDDLYTTDAPLGVNWTAGVPTVSVWAPTAQNVSFLLFDDSDPKTDAQELTMTRDDSNGVWSIVGEPDWKGKYYRYRVTVFAPSEMQLVVNDVTDPYSLSLSQNSQRSQVVDLADAELKPEGWDTLVKPSVENPEDITIYELHIRDFSAFDESIPAELRGTYLAFTVEGGSGTKHLTTLAEAGLTHLHLLPSFDIATINENRKRWFEPDYSVLASLPSDSDLQQAEIAPLRDLDGFNWGYDPYHYMTPEGSYSTDPNGTARVLEYRQMVEAINKMGLLVVQDVVFNHTNSSGQNDRSVLDRIVPGYYHRLNAKGVVERSTCCDNTATEHNMMRRLMIDTVIMNVLQYKIDAFRFDLMGHHMLADMVALREALNALTLEKDGVDGSRIYLYGEGWNFGEVADNQRGINATQLNIGGTGIGVFNDRLRDAVRGGNPFGDREKQGLANGIYSNPNGLSDSNEDLDRVLLFADQVRVGLAGNLRDYTFTSYTGDVVSGADVDYNGFPAGYTLDPQENILYIDKHDNETLFDNNIYKAPENTSMADRIRMQILGNAYILYGQGVPFFQAGTDLLRSKSMDRNSYNSGDWFNRLDFTMQTNNFGVGLPPSGDNSAEWQRMIPFLANPNNVPTADDIMATTLRFQDMLKVRYSSPLFRLTTAEEVQKRLLFLNVGPEQAPGVIVMVLDDTQGDDLDPNYSQVVVIFNANNTEITYSADELATMAWELHPVLADGHDDLLKTATFAEGTFTVPAYSAVVFVAK